MLADNGKLSISILQQLQKDQVQAVTPNKNQFKSLNDAVQRLLSYHVCQGSLPTEEDLRKGNFCFSNHCTKAVPVSLYTVGVKSVTYFIGF